MVIATIELKSSLEKFLKYGTQKGGGLTMLCSAASASASVIP